LPLCPLHRATFALRVILLPAAANVLRDPRFTSVQICLMRFLFRHATFAWPSTLHYIHTFIHTYLRTHIRTHTHTHTHKSEFQDISELRIIMAE
jgi:hypothetical protein